MASLGNSQGTIILFEPATSEHVSARTIDQIAVTALAPGSDCRTFAIGYVSVADNCQEPMLTGYFCIDTKMASA